MLLFFLSTTDITFWPRNISPATTKARQRSETVQLYSKSRNSPNFPFFFPRSPRFIGDGWRFEGARFAIRRDVNGRDNYQNTFAAKKERRLVPAAGLSPLVPGSLSPEQEATGITIRENRCFNTVAPFARTSPLTAKKRPDVDYALA